MRLPSFPILAAALGVTAPPAISAQPIGSGVRSISLIAIRRDDVEALDVVSVRTNARLPAAGDTVDLRMSVDVRRDMPCTIRVALRTVTAVSVRARDAGGQDQQLRPGTPVVVYHGHCAAGASAHPVSLRVAGAGSGETVSLEYEVVGSATGEPGRWVTGVDLNPPREH